jgi:hypothetical protein
MDGSGGRFSCTCLLSQSSEDILGRPAKVYLDRLAGYLVKDQDRRLRSSIEDFLRFQCNLRQLAGCNAPEALKGRTARVVCVLHLHTPWNDTEFYPGIKESQYHPGEIGEVLSGASTSIPERRSGSTNVFSSYVHAYN